MKTIKRSWKLLVAGIAALLVVLGVATLAGHLAGRAAASGIPQTDPLYYSGVLADTSGKMLAGSYTVGVDLYTAATGGTKACTTAGKSTTVTQGRFRVALDKTCVAAIQTYPDMWVEVTVGTTTMPRQKIGAVPYAVEAQAAADPDCPPGYTMDSTATTIMLCKRGKDEMVKVGSFWIDRYEITIVAGSASNSGKCDGTGSHYGVTGDDFPSVFPDSGAWTLKKYACSIASTLPSRFMTWFQAQQACLASGKRLCTNEEWQGAVAGTPDDLVSCNLGNLSATSPEKTGSRFKCSSSWGAMDMVGNLTEMVADWMPAGLGWMKTDGEKAEPWPSGYGDAKDGTWNLNSRASAGGLWSNGIPAIPFRGGCWLNNQDAGVFSMSLGAPIASSPSGGARCCRR